MMLGENCIATAAPTEMTSNSLGGRQRVEHAILDVSLFLIRCFVQLLFNVVFFKKKKKTFKLLGHDTTECDRELERLQRDAQLRNARRLRSSMATAQSSQAASGTSTPTTNRRTTPSNADLIDFSDDSLMSPPQPSLPSSSSFNATASSSDDEAQTSTNNNNNSTNASDEELAARASKLINVYSSFFLSFFLLTNIYISFVHTKSRC